MYCLFASPLMMVLLASVDCSANWETFKSEPSLTNRVCPADRRVFEEQTVSRVACMAAASQIAGCIAVAYNKEQKMCYGCDTATGEQLQTLEGTMFYSRPKAYHDGFQYISGYMLKVANQYEQGLKYDQAHDVCAVHSASLVRIDSPKKQTAIKNHLDTLSVTDRHYYVQCRKDTSDGVWKFDDGTPVPMTNDYWNTGRPYNNSGFNCGYMYSGSSYYWGNYYCDYKRGYICEMK